MRGKAGRRTAVTIALVALTAGIGVGTAHAAKVVLAVGGPEFTPNQEVRDTTRWSPGEIAVRPNERVTWIDRDEVPEPHTVTIVNRRNVPTTLQALFQCRACGLANAHLADPNDPNSDVARLKVNVGKRGLNTQGDSLFLPPRGRIAARVTAGVGRTLHYICAIHPWMQGQIHVTRTGTAGAGGGGAALTGRR